MIIPEFEHITINAVESLSKTHGGSSEYGNPETV